MNQSGPSSKYWIPITAILNIFSFLTLYLLRSLDDNRLTSWKWVFAQTDVIPIVAYLIMGFALAYALSKISSLERYPMGLFLVSFFMATLFWTEPEVIVDAARYFTQAKHLEIYGIGYFFKAWGKGIMAWTDLPLVPFIYGLIFKLFGEQRVYIQIFTTLLFSLTVLLTYLIGKTLWDEKTGFLGGLLLLGVPYLFSQVPLILVDIPTMFFLTLSIYTFIKAMEVGGVGWTVFSSLSVVLTLFCKYSTWVWLSILLMVVLVFLRMEPSKTLRRGGAVALLALLPAAAAILSHYDVISDQVRLLLSYQRPGLRRWGEGFVSTFFFQTHAFITLGALYSVYSAFKKKDLKYAIIGYLVFLIFLLQMKRIRYTIPLFPMLALMAAYGLGGIRNEEAKRFIAFSVLISSIVLAYFAYLPFLEKISVINLRDAGQFLNAIHGPNIEVLTLPQQRSIINPAVSVPILDLHTNKRIIYRMEIKQPPRIREEIEKSALRFTWEHQNPRYYGIERKGQAEAVAHVVIGSDPEQPRPRDIEEKIKAYGKTRVFDRRTGVFRYRTIVTVFYD